MQFSSPVGENAFSRVSFPQTKKGDGETTRAAVCCLGIAQGRNGGIDNVNRTGGFRAAAAAKGARARKQLAAQRGWGKHAGVGLEGVRSAGLVLDRGQGEGTVGVHVRKEGIRASGVCLHQHGAGCVLMVLLLQEFGQEHSLLRFFLPQGFFQRTLGTSLSNSSSTCRGGIAFLTVRRGRQRTHLRHFFRLGPLKEFTAENDGIIGTETTIDLTKAPTVQLAGEAAKLGRLEELGDDRAGELVAILNDKAATIVAPSHAKAFAMFLGMPHHFHELE